MVLVTVVPCPLVRNILSHGHNHRVHIHPHLIYFTFFSIGCLPSSSPCFTISSPHKQDPPISKMGQNIITIISILYEFLRFAPHHYQLTPVTKRPSAALVLGFPSRQLYFPSQPSLEPSIFGPVDPVALCCLLRPRICAPHLFGKLADE